MLGRFCLLVAVTKFPDKFASLEQVIETAKISFICCTDMNLALFLDMNFALF